MAFDQRVVERRLRRRGALLTGEELLSFTDARLILVEGEGEPFDVGPKSSPHSTFLTYTSNSVIVFALKWSNWKSWHMRRDWSRLAGVRDSSDVVELLFVADPPVRYQLKYRSTTQAADVAKELARLRQVRLEQLPIDDQALCLSQHADVFARRGETVRARELYLQVAEIGSAEFSPKAAMNYGLMLKRDGQYEAAVSYFQDAMNGDDPAVSGQAAGNLGFLLLLDHDITGARDHFERAKSLGNVKTDQALVLLAEIDDLTDSEKQALFEQIAQR